MTSRAARPGRASGLRRAAAETALLATWGEGVSGMAKSTESGRLALGRKGEALAASHLERSGYAIVARNARTRWGELDLVARDGEAWVFVEVKTRRGARFGQGAEAVTYAKQQKIIRMAQIYLARLSLWDVAIRFDVVEVSLDEQGEAQIRHLIGAFGA